MLELVDAAVGREERLVCHTGFHFSRTITSINAASWFTYGRSFVRQYYPSDEHVPDCGFLLLFLCGAILTQDANQTVPEALTKFGTHVKKKEHKLYGVFAKDVDMDKRSTKTTFNDSDEE